MELPPDLSPLRHEPALGGFELLVEIDAYHAISIHCCGPSNFHEVMVGALS
jgi:hypothetical protein